jgi:hypothetical protein
MKIVHGEQTSVGEIRHVYTFGQQEIKALRLLLSEENDLNSRFCSLWSNVSHYENASFGVKEMMPTIINKLQQKSQFNDLESVLKSDYLMLRSLPKYTWTKNWYARNQFFRIAKQLKHAEIDFVLLKGIAETFLDVDALTARTCRDIDILIHASQIKQFAHVVAKLGWECKDPAPTTLADLGAFAGNAFTFRHPSGIVELDVHFGGASLNWSSREEFVRKIWLEARRTHPDLLTPSDQCRLLTSAWNVFDVENIKSEQILKYFYDFMRGTKNMSVRDKFAFIQIARQNLDFAKQTMWLLGLDARLKRNWKEYIVFRLMHFFEPSCNWRLKIRTTEQIYYWLYHTKNIVKSRFNKRLKWYQMIFRTVVESDTYKARRDSYASIIKTKRDNLRSALLSRYGNTKYLLTKSNCLSIRSITQAIKQNISNAINLLLTCTNLLKTSLINFCCTIHKTIRSGKRFFETRPTDAAEARVKKIYFITGAYFR